MKAKTHSGAKKRIKVRKSGVAKVQKSCRNHLLVNKSKKQKKSYSSGMPISPSKMRSLRRIMPGKVVLKNVKSQKVEEKASAKAA